MAGYPVSLPFIGREAERSLLERVLDGVAKGRGGVLLVSGPTGSGKSRFLEFAMDRAVSRGFFVVQGHAVEGDHVPYLPFRRALEGPGRGGSPSGGGEDDEVASGLPLAAAAMGEGGGLRLKDYGRTVGVRGGLSKEWGGNALGELFPSAEGEEIQLEELPPTGAAIRFLERLDRLAGKAPAMVALDSFQWADTGSLALLRPLAREARKRSLVFVVGYDAGEATPATGAPAEGFTMEEIARSLQRESGAVRVPLRGLSDEEVRLLAQEVLGAPLSIEKEGALPEVLARTEGNPFFVQEVLRAGLRDGWIVRRAGAYRVMDPKEDLQVPTLIRWWVHRRTQGLPQEDRTLLEAISVLGSEFDPRALPALLPELAPQVKRILERLETKHGLVRPLRPSVWQVEPGFVASVVRSEMSGELLRRLHRRAGEWHAAHDPQGAERIAYHYHEAAEPSLALPWLERAWKTASDRGDIEAALRYARRGEEMARAGGLPESLTVWERREATGIFQTGDAVKAVEGLDRALEKAPAGIPRVDLLCELSLLETHRGNPEKALAMLSRASSEPVPPEQRSASELRIRVFRSEVLNRLQRWEEICQEAPPLIELLEREGADIEPRRRMGVRISYAMALMARGEFTKAREVLLDTLSRARKAGMVISQANVRTALGILASTTGELAMARAIFEQSTEDWRRRGAVTNQAINISNNAEVLLDLGELEEAQRWADHALELCGVVGLSHMEAMVTPIQARIALEKGDASRAEALLRPLLPAGRLESQREASREAHATMARILLAQGKVEEAWTEVQRGGQEVSGIGGAYTARTYAVVQAAKGETFRAEALLNRIILDTQKAGRRYDHAMALADLAGMLEKQGRLSEARARWDEALGELRACGALPRAKQLEGHRRPHPSR